MASSLKYCTDSGVEAVPRGHIKADFINNVYKKDTDPKKLNDLSEVKSQVSWPGT